MNRLLLLALFSLLPIFAAPAPAPDAAEEEKTIFDLATFEDGPVKADLGKYATIQVLEGFKFTDGDGARKVLEAMGNPTGDDELGFLAPTNSEWFVLFRFSDVGYVKDDDKDKLNPDKLLTAIKKGTEQSNKVREKMGVAPMKIIGWEVQPKYNEQTHNLEWAIRGESEGDAVVNYNTRILGRSGVMEALLVIDPTKLQETLPTFQTVLKGYGYKAGETYAEYRQGDKMAKYGLAALVTGGAAAVAVKTGLLGSIILFFKKGAKAIIIGLVAIGALIKKLVLGRGRQEN